MHLAGVAAFIAALWWMTARVPSRAARAGEDETAARAPAHLTAVKLAITAALHRRGSRRHLATTTTHIEQGNSRARRHFAIAYPILAASPRVRTVAAVAFIPGLPVEGLRFLGGWATSVRRADRALHYLRPAARSLKTAAGLRRILPRFERQGARRCGSGVRRLARQWRRVRFELVPQQAFGGVKSVARQLPRRRGRDLGLMAQRLLQSTSSI